MRCPRSMRDLRAEGAPWLLLYVARALKRVRDLRAREQE